MYAYERSKNFQNIVEVLLPDDVSVSWPSSGYTSLLISHHELLSKISPYKVWSYFSYRLAIDSLSENILAMEG